jgi:hypothetical protein
VYCCTVLYFKETIGRGGGWYDKREKSPLIYVSALGDVT